MIDREEKKKNKVLNGGGRKSCHIKMQKQNGTKLNGITEWEWKEIKTLGNQSVSKAYWVSSMEEIQGVYGCIGV